MRAGATRNKENEWKMLYWEIEVVTFTTGSRPSWRKASSQHKIYLGKFRIRMYFALDEPGCYLFMSLLL